MRKDDFIASLVGCLIVGIVMGVFLHSKLGGDSRDNSPVIVAVPNSAPQVNYEKHDQAKLEEMQNQQDTLEKFEYFSGEAKRAKEFDYPKNAEEAAGNVQFTYRLIGQLEDLQTDVEANQFTRFQVGFTKAELRKLIKDTYRTTLRQIDTLHRVGPTNRCIWEGGCFTTRKEIRKTRAELLKDLAQFSQS